jgi:Fe-S-cluster containining protein
MTSDRPAKRVKAAIKTDPDQWAEHLIEPATLEAFYEDCDAALKKSTEADAIRAMADAVTADVDKIWSALEPEQPAYACHKGCSWCCHQNVTVTLPELLQVVRYLRKTLDADALTALKEKLAASAKASAGKNSDQRFDARMACGFLEQDVCTIHPARPLQCRGGFSEDAGYCESLLTDRVATQEAVHSGERAGAFLIAPKMIYSSAQAAMAFAMEEADCDGAAYELTAAAAILLDSAESGAELLSESVREILKVAQLEKSDSGFATPARN